jgi:selenocysteine lyase/cysteine desulfurase
MSSFLAELLPNELSLPTQVPPSAGLSPGELPLAELTGAGETVPVVTGGRVRYVNLDYAASAPPLSQVARLVGQVLPLYASVHRGAGYASQACTAAYEAARRDVAACVGACGDDVTVFTRNTTDALNLLARAVPGPVVCLDIEHHATLLPWRDRIVVPVQPTLRGTLAAVEAALEATPAALLAVTGASNVTGECPPLAHLAALAHRHGARLAVDGAQLVPHRRVDIAATGIDYLAFSGHKIYAPFGAGALVGRRDWLDAATPYLAGGGAVRSVDLESVHWADAPARHEGGTPNVVGALALAAAVRCVASLPRDAVRAHESALLDRLTDGLACAGARVLRIWPGFGPDGAPDRVAVASFTVPGYPAALVASYLSAEHGIGVRDGKFCAHPLLARLAGDGDGTAVRASLGLGSRAEDVDRLVGALKQLRAQGPAWTYDAHHIPAPDPRPLPAWAVPSLASFGALDGSLALDGRSSCAAQ